MVKPQFSIRSLFLAATVVAAAMVALTSLSTTWRLQREITNLKGRIQAAEKAAAIRKVADEAEYLGIYRDPVVLIDLRLPKVTPWVLHASNSKYLGQGRTIRVGPPGGKVLRSVTCDLRLLRSLDGVDYYRFKCTVDGNAQPDVLFQYFGKPETVVVHDSMVVTMAPDREAGIKAAASVYTATDAVREWR